MIKKSPIFGIGAGNFVVELGKMGKTTWLQPVHNIFLLVANELGLVGIMGIILVFKKWIMNLSKVAILLLIIIGLSGMTDHYWLTLMQNNWLLVLVFGLI
jgi:O-antigen ligase